MNGRNYWPFPISEVGAQSEPLMRQIHFLERAASAGHRPYIDDGNVLGALSADGRSAEMIPRGGIDKGLRRYWEVLLIDSSNLVDSFFVDGFDNAANGALRWLAKMDCSQVRFSISDHIVLKPHAKKPGSHEQ